MRGALVVAAEALQGFARQKLFLALVVITLGGSCLFAYFVSWQQQTFQTVQDQKLEDLSSEGRKVSKADMEQGLEQMGSFEQAMFFGGASFCGTLIALVLFSTIVATPLRRGEVRGVLIRPLRRSSYILGRCLAAVAALALYWAMMSVVLLIFSRITHTPLAPVAHYAGPLFFFKGVMTGCIALAFSMFMRPAVAAPVAFFASSDWVSSNGPLYYLLPGDDRLGTALQILHGTVLSQKDLALAIAYALTVAAAALWLTILRFDRVDLT